MIYEYDRNNVGKDLIDNPSTRCACMIILDTSWSMNGEPIFELNQGIQRFIHSVQEDEIASYSVEISIITAGDSVEEILPFTTAMNIKGIQPLTASGLTPLGEATKLALQRLEQRKTEYKRTGVAYYQPWLVIISDGKPTDEYETIASQTKQLSQQRKLVVLPVGVTDADMEALNKFSSRGAKKLYGLKFNELFEWLSASMSRVSISASTSAQVLLPSTDSWESI